MAKRLYRSRESSVIAGVCGGLGEYLDIDPVFIRILMVLLVLAHGIGLIAYIVAWIAMPRTPGGVVTAKPEPSEMRKYLPGIILIAIGVIFLLDRLFWWFHWHHIWPILLIVAGVALIWRSFAHSNSNGGVNESVES
jgi:phage shock protein C